jgi:hypothetical protein
MYFSRGKQGQNVSFEKLSTSGENSMMDPEIWTGKGPGVVGHPNS